MIKVQYHLLLFLLLAVLSNGTVLLFGAVGRRRGASSTDSSDLVSTAAIDVEGENAVQLVSQVKMWPPWPLSLLNRRSEDEIGSGKSGNQTSAVSSAYPSAAAVFFAYIRQRSRIGLRQIQEIGSSLWFHLPPAIPPLLLLSSLPVQERIKSIEGATSEAAAEVLTRRVIPLFSNSFARNVVLRGTGIAVISWAHQELHRKRKLTPLPLELQYQQSVSRVFLPPFLPESIAEAEGDDMDESSSEDSAVSGPSSSNNEDEDVYQRYLSSILSPKLRKHLSSFYESKTVDENGKVLRRPTGIYREWKGARLKRQREAAKFKRLAVFDELRALQAIKKKSAKKGSKKRGASSQDDLDPLGYALVTGASQGIGRALAVELARWEIPLVLVARDVDRLTSLAFDLEACYGIKCCVLQADLSKIDAAERIYETTQKAGIPIDILVNNAGIAHEGLLTSISTDLVERMLMVNTMSYAKLSKLYGQDMIKRGRGRILMVSSMAGLTTAAPNTALYGATKSFERSLALSMAKEMEPYGVGVTCLLPGAVSSTQFGVRSGIEQALCWKLPFYARPAEAVAHQGVMSLLDGDTQNVPGWQNRIFVQVLRPIIPQRIETMCVQAAFSPLRLPKLGQLLGGFRSKDPVEPNESSETINPPPKSEPIKVKSRLSSQRAPKLLQLMEGADEEVEKQGSDLETIDSAEAAPTGDTQYQNVTEPVAPPMMETSPKTDAIVDSAQREEHQQKEEEEQEVVVEQESPSLPTVESPSDESPPVKSTSSTNNLAATRARSYLKHDEQENPQSSHDLSPMLGPVNLLESQVHTPTRGSRTIEIPTNLLEV